MTDTESITYHPLIDLYIVVIPIVGEYEFEREYVIGVGKTKDEAANNLDYSIGYLTKEDAFHGGLKKAGKFGDEWDSEEIEAFRVQ